MKGKLSLGIVLLTALLIPSAVRAQSDTLKNKLTLGANLLGHGEICAGGLPRNSGTNTQEDYSGFLLGRIRLNAEYERKYLQLRFVVQNLWVWGMSGNQALKLYEGWAKIGSRVGLFAQLGRVALSYDDERIIGTNDLSKQSIQYQLKIIG